jgi:hypothetical protein
LLTTPAGKGKYHLASTRHINEDTTAVRATSSPAVPETEAAFVLRSGPQQQVEDIFIAPTAEDAASWIEAIN